MEFLSHSKNYKIIKNEVLIAFDKDSDIKVNIIFNSQFGFNLSFSFIKDATKNAKYNITFDEPSKTFLFKCVNCDNSLGICTTTPIELATFESKKVFINFWIYRLGDDSPYKIEYCLYHEE